MFIGAFLSGKPTAFKLNATNQSVKICRNFHFSPDLSSLIPNYIIVSCKMSAGNHWKITSLSNQVSPVGIALQTFNGFHHLVNSCCAFCITSATIRHCSVVLTLQQVRRVGRRTGMSHPNLQAISGDLRVTYGNVFM